MLIENSLKCADNRLISPRARRAPCPHTFQTSGEWPVHNASFASTTTMTSSQQQTIPGQQRRDHPRITPTLPHLVTQLEQLPPASPQNAGRPRKSAKAKLLEKARAAERRREPEEPRFNVAAPVQTRHGRRPNARVARPSQTEGTPVAQHARSESFCYSILLIYPHGFQIP